MEKTKKPIYQITECAVMVALAIALSFVDIPVGALGGSIDFVMVPLFIICYRQGAKYSILACLVFGFLKCLVGGGIGYGLPSILLDYVLAYGVCGVAGFFKGNKKMIEVSVFLGCLARYMIHVISGWTIYKIAVPTEVKFFGMIANPWAYSLAYNLVYMLPNTVIAIVVMALLRYPLSKLDKMGY